MKTSEQKIVPCLWFDNNAEEAVNMYVSLFHDSGITKTTRYTETSSAVAGKPAGSVMTLEFHLEGQQFIALNGGPEFSFTPAISFFISCRTRERLDELWNGLSEGAMVLMQLDRYPFSERFGWIQDKFGVSWQLMLSDHEEKISPYLMFVGDNSGKAEEAMNFYTSLFPDSEILGIEKYIAEEDEPEGNVKYASFSLAGQEFMAMDSSIDHKFGFSLAISFMVNCDTQQEIDKYWHGLIAGGGEEGQCGWLSDRYGVSWQVVTPVLDKMLDDEDPIRSNNVMEALLKMKKIEIDKLEQAYHK